MASKTDFVQVKDAQREIGGAMLILDLEQGTEDWLAARRGIPTASNFDKILTPTGQPSRQAEGYMNRLLAEWLMGKSVDIEKTEWMQRGNDLEHQARAYYTFVTDVEARTVGLVYRDDRKLVACSPDGLVGDDGGLEIKCPAPWTHVGYLLDGKLPTDYIPQVQGNMLVTGRSWWDFLSFHPDMEPLLVRVPRNEEYCAKLDVALNMFITRMLECRERLRKP